MKDGRSLVAGFVAFIFLISLFLFSVLNQNSDLYGKFNRQELISKKMSQQERVPLKKKREKVGSMEESKSLYPSCEYVENRHVTFNHGYENGTYFSDSDPNLNYDGILEHVVDEVANSVITEDLLVEVFNEFAPGVQVNVNQIVISPPTKYAVQSVEQAYVANSTYYPNASTDFAFLIPSVFVDVDLIIGEDILNIQGELFDEVSMRDSITNDPQLGTFDFGSANFAGRQGVLAGSAVENHHNPALFGGKMSIFYSLDFDSLQVTSLNLILQDAIIAELDNVSLERFWLEINGDGSVEVDMPYPYSNFSIPLDLEGVVTMIDGLGAILKARQLLVNKVSPAGNLENLRSEWHVSFASSNSVPHQMSNYICDYSETKKTTVNPFLHLPQSTYVREGLVYN